MPSSPVSVCESDSALSQVQGLRSFWAVATGREGRSPTRGQAVRVMLDTLGLGLEQTYNALASRPAYEDFEAWILKTAGPPDPQVLARYHAWLDGAEPPAEIRRRLQAVADAAPVLSADDLAHWDAEGYVILRRAITAEQAAAAEALLWRSISARPDDQATWYGPRTNGIMIQLFQDPALETARRSARVHKAFAQLWRTTDLWMTTDRMSFNPPEKPDRPFAGPHLHWDVSLARPIPFATQGILYLTDTAADQGALQLVPGFHHRLDGWLDGLADADPRRVDLSAEARTIAAGAGDLIIWRQDLPHGASPNRTDRPRMAQYVNMYSADMKSNSIWL